MPVSETIYAYAVGRIRVLETRLLNKNNLERMVESSSTNEALKILAETDYANAVAELTNIYDFEKILRTELQHTYMLIKKINPEAHRTDLISLKYDIHNLKVLLKAKYLNVARNDLLFPMGIIPLDKLGAIMAEENFKELPIAMCTAVEQIIEEFNVSGDPQIIDLILDQILYEILIGSARDLRSTFLEDLFTKEIDLTNIKTFLRVKRMGHNKNFFKKTLLPHGRIPTDLLINLLEEPIEFLTSYLAMSNYATVVNEGVREWQKEGSTTYFEKLSDDFLTDYLQQGKRKTFGLEPLVAYLYAKEIEVKNIRTILVGKINRLPIEAIRERLRNVYV